MHIKTTARHYHRPTRMAKVLKKHITQVEVRQWRHWNCHTLLLGMHDGTVILQNSLAISYKGKHILTIQPNNSPPKRI